MSLAPVPDAPLDATDADALAAQESIIRRSLADSSAALATIRDRRLYRAAGFDNFDGYCRDRLGFGRERADQIITAGHTLAALPTMVGNAPNERQARALAPLRDDPEALTSAWQAANDAAEAKGKPVTAADVAAAAAERRDTLLASLPAEPVA